MMGKLIRRNFSTKRVIPINKHDLKKKECEEAGLFYFKRYYFFSKFD